MPLLNARNARNCPETLNRPVLPCAAQAAPERGHRAGWRVRGAIKRDLKAFKWRCRLRATQQTDEFGGSLEYMLCDAAL